jgi:hypothetical protein
VALNKPGQQFSFDDLRNELALGAGPVSLGDPRVLNTLDRLPGDTSPVSFNSFDGQASYRPPASMQFTAARASQYLVRNCPAGANAQTYTINVWVKQLSFVANNFFMAAYNSANNYDNIGFQNNGTIQAYALVSSIFRWRLDTVKAWPLNQWHNVHLTADINNAAITDRVRLWVNGERQTNFTTQTQPTLGNNGYMNNPGQLNYIGIFGSTPYADMRIADHIMLDDVILGPEVFGEYVGRRWVAKRFDITKYRRGPASFHLNFANRNTMTSAMVNLSTGRLPVGVLSTDWNISGVWNPTTDLLLDRPRSAEAP